MRRARQRRRRASSKTTAIIAVTTTFILVSTAVAIILHSYAQVAETVQNQKYASRYNAVELSETAGGNLEYDADGYVTNSEYLQIIADRLNSKDVSVEDAATLAELGDVSVSLYGKMQRYNASLKVVHTDEISDVDTESQRTIRDESQAFLAGSPKQMVDTTIWYVDGDKIKGVRKEMNTVVNEKYPEGRDYYIETTSYSPTTTTATLRIYPPRIVDVQSAMDSPATTHVVKRFQEQGWKAIIDVSVMGDEGKWAGESNKNSRTIRFAKTEDAYGNTEVTYHELGHFVDCQSKIMNIAPENDTQASDTEQWQSIYDECCNHNRLLLSDYALSSASELFAAAYAKYIVEPDLLMSFQPQAYDYIQKIDGNFRLAMEK